MLQPKPTAEDFNRIIGAAEGNYAEVLTEYDDNRLYYEGEQKPSAADEKTFIMRNLITDYVNRQVSKLVAGEIQPSYVGGNELTDAAKELVSKMLEYNQFSEFGIEYFGNLFEIEGLAGWKFSFDPYEISPFGLGTPRIDVLGPGEILLDPNNPNPFNYKEDIVRIFKTRMTLDEAQARWYLKKNELTSLSDENSGNETTQWVDVYEVEHKVMTYYPAALSEDPAFANVKEAKVPDYIKKKYTGNGKYKLLDQEILDKREIELQIRVPVFFTTTIVNKVVIVEDTKPNGYGGFTIIPAFNVIRFKYRKYPTSNIRMLRDTQDQINILLSVLTEIVKAVPKSIPYITGAADSEIARAKIEAAKPDGFVWFNSPATRVMFPPSPQLPPSLTQFLDMQMQMLDRIGADYSPSRGEVEGDISGRAIGFLQSRDDLTQYVQKKHVEASLTELFRRMLECAMNQMVEPFSIDREIDGEDKKIYFNTSVESVQFDTEEEAKEFEEDNLNTVQEGIINNLKFMTIPEIKVDVQLNVFQKKAEEIQKANMSLQAQMIAPLDYHKAMYPEKWLEIHNNWLEWNAAAQVMQTLVTAFGPEITQAIPDIVKFAQVYMQQAQSVGQGMGGPVGTSNPKPPTSSGQMPQPGREL